MSDRHGQCGTLESPVTADYSQGLDVLELLHLLAEPLGLHLQLLQVVSGLLVSPAVCAALPVSTPLFAGHFIDYY